MRNKIDYDGQSYYRLDPTQCDFVLRALAYYAFTHPPLAYGRCEEIAAMLENTDALYRYFKGELTKEDTEDTAIQPHPVEPPFTRGMGESGRERDRAMSDYRAIALEMGKKVVFEGEYGPEIEVEDRWSADNRRRVLSVVWQPDKDNDQFVEVLEWVLSTYPGETHLSATKQFDLSFCQIGNHAGAYSKVGWKEAFLNAVMELPEVQAHQESGIEP